jgi:hypothetical protein
MMREQFPLIDAMSVDGAAYLNEVCFSPSPSLLFLRYVLIGWV